MSIKPDDRVQLTLGGKSIADEYIERQLENVPDQDIICPFCFARQKLRVMKQFNSQGEMLKKNRCNFCKRQMEPSTSLATTDPRRFAAFISGYKMFWQTVDHDAWMESFKKAFDRKYLDAFWAAYAEFKPDFKEKRQIEELWQEYSKQ